MNIIYVILQCNFLDQWLSHAAQGLSGILFPDVIELTKTNTLDGPIRTPCDIRSFKYVFGRDSVMVRSWSGDLPASGFPLRNSFCFICPCSALTRHYQHYSNFFPVTSLISSHDWVHWRIFVLSANFIFRRKFRSQTSDNMDIWKAEVGRVREEREKKKEDQKKRKSQKKEDPGAWKGRKVAKHFVFPMICGSGGSRSRLAKAVGAEPAGQMRDEKLHAVVARSTFRSQKC